MHNRKLIHPGWNLDYLMFIFTRVSGVCILLLTFIGMASAFILGARLKMDLSTLMRWTFFPNPNHVSASVPDVQEGWVNGFWQIIQILIVMFGATHGINGLRVILEDYFHSPILHIMVRISLFLLWLFVLLVAFFVIQAS